MTLETRDMMIDSYNNECHWPGMLEMLEKNIEGKSTEESKEKKDNDDGKDDEMCIGNTDEETLIGKEVLKSINQDEKTPSEKQIIDSLTDMVDDRNMEAENEEDLNAHKGITMEMEFECEDIELSNASMIAYAIELITKWKENKMIDGVLGLNKRLLDDNLDHHDRWMIAPRMIQKKYYYHVNSEFICNDLTDV